MLSDLQNQFFEAAKAYESHKEQGKVLRERLDGLMKLMGEGYMLQDPTTGAVYQITRPTGTYVEFREIGYGRTALPGETRGSLSKKEAEEAGFSLPGKK